MSILIDGILTSSVARGSGSTTLISASYVRTAFPRRPAAAPFVLTLHTLDRGALTVVLPCRISSQIDSDIILVLDWKAALRELLLGLGFPVPATFNPWALFLPLVPLVGAPGTSDRGVLGHDASLPHVPMSHVLMPPVLNVINSAPVIVPDRLPTSVGSVGLKPVILPRNYDLMFFPSSSSSSQTLPSPSDDLPLPHVRCVSDGRDRLESLLVSADSSCNIFSQTNQQWFSDLLHGHGIQLTNMSSLHACRQALLTHFFSGACSTLYRASAVPECNLIREGFEDSRDLAHLAMSLLISSSHTSHYSLLTIASVLGVDVAGDTNVDTVSEAVQAKLIKQRALLVAEFSEDHPSKHALDGLDSLSLASLTSLATLHGLPCQDRSLSALRHAITTHFASGACGTQPMGALSIACQSVVRQMFPSPPSEALTQEDFQQMLQIRMLTQLQPRLSRAVARRILTLHNVEFSMEDGPAKLRSLVGKYLKSLDSKRPCYKSKQVKRDVKTAARARESNKLKEEWPQLISPGFKEKFKKHFNQLISREALSTFTCGSCVERCNIKLKSTISFEEFDLNLLRRPDESTTGESDVSDCESEAEEAETEEQQDTEDMQNVPPAPWLDREMIPPSMPVKSGPYESLLIDPQCIEDDPDSMEPVLVVCKTCKSNLKAGVVPRLSMANHNFLGSVPSELKDLTVVEEAMIARCRAKCWIIQLREDDDSGLPNVQRGFKGHIIVYPQQPSAIVNTLPPSIEEITTPICVVFVGSKPPTPEWIRTKAKPLIVRKEKVMNALDWLATHNHLYKDVTIDRTVFEGHGEIVKIPFHIEHILPSDGIEATTSSYSGTKFGTDMRSTVQSESQTINASVKNMVDSMLTGAPAQADIEFESVVVTDVKGHESSSVLRKAATRHLKKAGGNYLELRHDPTPVNEFNNPDLFPLIYPTLFPYGIGGAEDKRRRTRLGFKSQLKHFFNLADRRFQEHYSFLFTAFNMLQRRTLLQHTSYKVKRENFDAVAAQFATVSASAIHTVSERISKGDFQTSNSEEESRVLALMKQVNLISSHVQGSPQSKLVMRNEIRGLMIDKGLPSFYITINPADVYNPLVRFLAGDEIDIDNLTADSLSNVYKDQSILIAQNPAVAAEFFNVFIKAFIAAILGYDPKQLNTKGGILGVVNAYYGTVEAQGRGSLHCHMVVWVEGGLNPNEIKAKALECGGNLGFQKRLMEFLEDTISTAIPPDPRPDLKVPLDKFHPCSTRGPAGGIPPEDLEYAREKDLHNLVEKCQFHVHTRTCYKYWKGPGYAKECRFDLDESNVRPISQFDPETGEFELRCLDGLVNNFNTTMLEAIRCNMDIKFISSGPAAKAVMYYITDYITKSQLQAHVAYAALELAVTRLGEYDPEEDDFAMRARRLLQKCAHSMIAQQEMSGHQVVSYLMDFEDHFTSHKFSNLYWPSLERFLDNERPSPECYKTTDRAQPDSELDPPTDQNILDGDASEDHENEPYFDEDAALADILESETQPNQEDDGSPESENIDDIRVKVDRKGRFIATANQGADYQHRGPDLASVNVWDFVARIEKVRKKRARRDHKRKCADKASDESEAEHEHEDTENPETRSGWDKDTDGDILSWSGRARPTVDLETEHLESDTHVLRLLPPTMRKVPVPIGPALPRRDRDELKHKHARLMLILFKPWRHAQDLIGESQTWIEAYEDFLQTCSPEIQKIIDNMQILHECKDSRDNHYRNRHKRRSRDGVSSELLRGNDGNIFGEMDEGDILDHLESIDLCHSNRHQRTMDNILQAKQCADNSGMFGTENEMAVADAIVVDSHHDLVHDRNPALEQSWDKNYSDRKDMWKNVASNNNAKTVNDQTPETSTSTGSLLRSGNFFRGSLPQLYNSASIREPPDQAKTLKPEAEAVIKTMIDKYTLNTEQIRAFNIVAHHSTDLNADPLRMYLGGPGGTGKSRVIDALKDFFETRGEKRRFRLSSYTGVAARNISGMTLHAALGMRQKGERQKTGKALRDIMAMWEGVDYLFIDEISMVGCALLYDISSALSAAKGSTLAFGGINLIFAGDFSQLPPVGQSRLYAHIDPDAKKKPQKKRSGIRTAKAGTEFGQKDIFGKLLWLSVRTVVLLTEIVRQSGPENQPFLDLLGRLRDGRCTEADLQTLNSRLLSNLDIDWTTEPWKNAPIIVNENHMKDELNIKAARAFAKETGRKLHWYYARDKIGKVRVEETALTQRLMSLDSGKTNQRLGKIPLVIGMPVMFAQNFDVPGGVVNGCSGILKSVRYKVDEHGNRYAISCVVEAPDTDPGLIPGLPDHHVVALEDTVDFKLEHPYTFKSCTVKRTQLPIQPGFVMTAYKAQGRTLQTAVVNLSDCRGTEAPYVMISRVTSLAGLAILTPFEKARICCRPSEDLRRETKRLEILSLKTLISHGTEEERAAASEKLQTICGRDINEEPDSANEDENSIPEDPAVRLKKLQMKNLRLTTIKPAQVMRRKRKDLDAPVTFVTESAADRPADPRHVTLPKRKRVPLDTPLRPQPAFSSHPRAGGEIPATSEWDPMEWVESSSMASVRRHKRKALDQPREEISNPRTPLHPPALQDAVVGRAFKRRRLDDLGLGQ